MDKTSSEKEYWWAVWEKFRSGDSVAFKIIYDEYIDVLFSYGSKITSDKSLLEDSIQDLFLDIYTYKIKLQKIESLEFYLFKTLKHIIFRKLKENSHYIHQQQFTEKFDLLFKIENDDTELTDNYLKLLQDELKQLNQQKRELIFLKFNSGLTYVEIGSLLEQKPDTVKKQINRILKLIRSYLEKE